MAELFRGQTRAEIFNVRSLSLTTGSIGLAVTDAKFFRRFVGMMSVLGSATLTYRMGPSSGNFIVSSSVIANSGTTPIDVLNLGKCADFAITAANSQPNIAAFLIGDSQR